MSRPKADIDPAEVQRMAFSGAPVSTIADALGVDESTIRARFPEIVKKARAERRIKLFQRQWDVAMGDSRHSGLMLIWLGKQEGQTERPEPEAVTQKPVELKVVRPDLTKLGT